MYRLYHKTVNKSEFYETLVELLADLADYLENYVEDADFEVYKEIKLFDSKD